jgi:hypothetical protein
MFTHHAQKRSVSFCHLPVSFTSYRVVSGYVADDTSRRRWNLPSRRICQHIRRPLTFCSVLGAHRRVFSGQDYIGQSAGGIELLTRSLKSVALPEIRFLRVDSFFGCAWLGVLNMLLVARFST